MVSKVYVSMGDNSIKNSQTKVLKAHAYLHIIGKKSTKFQMNPMKDAGGVGRLDHGWQSLSQHGR